MNIILLRNKACHIWQTQLEVLQEVLKEKNISIIPKVFIIESPIDAAQYKFLGSPTILIDGKDIDEPKILPEKYTEHGCRLYVYQGKVYEYAPKEMLKEVILKNL